MLFFKNKNIIDCTLMCDARNFIYGTDDNGKNISTSEFVFSFLVPENTKLLYEYTEDSNKYKIGVVYNAKFNTKTGTFEIKGERR